MLRFISSLLLLISLYGYSQDASDIVEDIVKVDTLPKWRIRSLNANLNLMRLGENLLNKPRTSDEINLELGIHKFFLVADFGLEETERTGYAMDGSYWRVGVDANLSTAWDDGQMIGIGLRVAQASFSDQAAIQRTIPSDPEIVQEILLSNNNLTANWAELVFKIRGGLSKNIYTGYTMRYQVYLVTKPYPEELRPFDVPGYGKTKRPNSFQFDFYIGWRLNFD